MASSLRNQYEPDRVSAPGDTLQEDALEERCMTQADLAIRTGRTAKTINEIIQGKGPITPETAIQLERVLGVSSSFWNSREKNYREYLAKRAEQESLIRQKSLLKQLPVAQMIKMGYLPALENPVEQVRSILNFFAVASPELIETNCMATFRRPAQYQSEPLALAAWLRRGEILGQEIRTFSYEPAKFKAVLKDARGLTRNEPNEAIKTIVDKCAEAGVAVVFLPEIKGCRVSGAARWLNPNKPLIQLSFRYQWDDQIWFTFFHEAAHILLHGKKQTFVDESIGSTSDAEDQANSFAANLLIPHNKYQQFVNMNSFNEYAIHNFAIELGIAPSIVLGRLQFDKHVSPGSKLNWMKRKISGDGKSVVVKRGW